MNPSHKSHLQTVVQASPIGIADILSHLPGCKARYTGTYRDTIERSFAGMDVMRSYKFTSIGSFYADEGRQRDLFCEYMLTEYWGGKFIEDYLKKNPHTPHQGLLQRHAADEKRHSGIFAGLARTSLAEHLASEAYRKEERFHQAYERWVGEDFFALVCLLHGFELRSAIIQAYWFTMMEMFPQEKSAALRPVFDEISTDEVFHVTYTMQLICDALDTGADPEILHRAVTLAEAGLEQVEALAAIDIAGRTAGSLLKQA